MVMEYMIFSYRDVIFNFKSSRPGLKVHPKLFSVQRINKLVDKYGLESFKDVVAVGDTLISVDNRILGAVRIRLYLLSGWKGIYLKLCDITGWKRYFGYPR